MRKNEKRFCASRRSVKRCAGLALLTALCMQTTVLPVFASSPSFARSAEEWAQLQDNRIEYGELAGLIEEYNPAVQQNQYDLNQFRKDYGDTKDSASLEYMRLANELRDDIVYPDSGDPGYASMMTAALTAEVQANNLEKLADDNLEDAEIKRLSYEMAKMALVQTAQNNMIGWKINSLAVRNAEIAKELAATGLSVFEAQAGVGMATQVDVLTARQSLQNAEKGLISAQNALSTSKQKLQIMLGWKADADPEMGEIPVADLARIDAMDPAADLERAKENNYTLRINKKKLENANGETDIKTLNSTIADNEARIAVSLRNAYQSVTSARDAYNYAKLSADLKIQSAEQTAQMYGLGTASAVTNTQAQLGREQAELSLLQAELQLFQAMEAYDWAVNGLAAASAS